MTGEMLYFFTYPLGHFGETPLIDLIDFPWTQVMVMDFAGGWTFGTAGFFVGIGVELEVGFGATGLAGATVEVSATLVLVAVLVAVSIAGTDGTTTATALATVS